MKLELDMTYEQVEELANKMKKCGIKLGLHAREMRERAVKAEKRIKVLEKEIEDLKQQLDLSNMEKKKMKMYEDMVRKLVVALNLSNEDPEELEMDQQLLDEIAKAVQDNMAKSSQIL